MRKVLPTCLLLAGVLLVMPIGAATAQNSCPEGRTADGTCVDGPLAALMRQNAVIYSQSQLSYTAYPVLPSGDWSYRYPNQLIPNPLAPSMTGEYLPPPPPP
jgi:hypothetical protein